MLLVLDNFDSFTHNLLDYFSSLGAPYKLFRNNQPIADIIAAGPYTGLVISPGPETPSKAGCLTEVLQHYLHQIPVLGICLGHQAIGEHFGACLGKAKKPMHGKVSTIQHTQHPIFKGLPTQLNVVRYHSLILSDLPDSLQAIAHTQSDEIMAIAHTDLPLTGLQFHPEAWLTQHGKQLLANWVGLVKAYHIEASCQLASSQEVAF